jgi:hypothetical protein
VLGSSLWPGAQIASAPWMDESLPELGEVCDVISILRIEATFARGKKARKKKKKGSLRIPHFHQRDNSVHLRPIPWGHQTPHHHGT